MEDILDFDNEKMKGKYSQESYQYFLKSVGVIIIILGLGMSKIIMDISLEVGFLILLFALGVIIIFQVLGISSGFLSIKYREYNSIEKIVGIVGNTIISILIVLILSRILFYLL